MILVPDSAADPGREDGWLHDEDKAKEAWQGAAPPKGLGERRLRTLDKYQMVPVSPVSAVVH